MLSDEVNPKERPLMAQGQRSQSIFSRILVVITVFSSSFPFGGHSPTDVF